MRTRRTSIARTARSVIEIWSKFASLKFGSLDVLCLGTASRSRPLNNANRSQRVFYSLATRFAALPPIPPQFLTSTSVPDEVDEENITAGLQDTDLEAFGKLLGVGGRGDEKAAELAATIAQETATNPADDTAIVEGTAASLSRRPGLPRGLSALNTPTRRSTAPPVSSLSIPSRTPSVAHSLDSSSVKSTKTTSASNSRPSSIYANDAPAASQPRPARNAWPAPFAYEPEDLPRLHQNLQNRLKPFFSQKLQNRQVRLSIYPAEGIWDKPLATKVVITTEAGTFRETVSLGEKELKIILGRDAGGSAEEERERLALMRVKVVTELLEAVGEEAVSDAKGIIASDEVTLDITKHDGLLVISDIDDTIKVGPLPPLSLLTLIPVAQIAHGSLRLDASDLPERLCARVGRDHPARNGRLVPQARKVGNRFPLRFEWSYGAFRYCSKLPRYVPSSLLVATLADSLRRSRRWISCWSVVVSFLTQSQETDLVA